jgi:hypothetical protein
MSYGCYVAGKAGNPCPHRFESKTVGRIEPAAIDENRIPSDIFVGIFPSRRRNITPARALEMRRRQATKLFLMAK